MGDDEVQIVDDKSRKRGRPNDSIWEMFKKKNFPGRKRLAAECNFCDSVILDGRPENLYRHIHECPAATSEVKAKAFEMEAKKAVSTPLPPKGLKRKSLDNSVTNSSESKQQSRVTSYCQRRLPDTMIQTIHVKLLRMIIMCSLSFVLVENPFFIDFIQSLCPTYVPLGTAQAIYGYTIPLLSFTSASAMLSQEGSPLISDG